MRWCGKAVEPTDRIGIPIGPDGDVVTAVAYVNAGGIRMHHRESGIGGLQPTCALYALLAIQRTGRGHAGSSPEVPARSLFSVIFRSVLATV